MSILLIRESPVIIHGAFLLPLSRMLMGNASIPMRLMRRSLNQTYFYMPTTPMGKTRSELSEFNICQSWLYRSLNTLTRLLR